MQFYSTRDLRSTPKEIWADLAADGEVVITNNGKPAAIMINIMDGDFEQTIAAIRQARAMQAFNAIRAQAAKAGYFTDEQINAEIEAVRRERKSEK